MRKLIILASALFICSQCKQRQSNSKLASKTEARKSVVLFCSTDESNFLGSGCRRIQERLNDAKVPFLYFEEPDVTELKKDDRLKDLAPHTPVLIHYHGHEFLGHHFIKPGGKILSLAPAISYLEKTMNNPQIWVGSCFAGAMGCSANSCVGMACNPDSPSPVNVELDVRVKNRIPGTELTIYSLLSVITNKDEFARADLNSDKKLDTEEVLTRIFEDYGYLVKNLRIKRLPGTTAKDFEASVKSAFDFCEKDQLCANANVKKLQLKLSFQDLIYANARTNKAFNAPKEIEKYGLKPEEILPIDWWVQSGFDERMKAAEYMNFVTKKMRDVQNDRRDYWLKTNAFLVSGNSSYDQNWKASEMIFLSYERVPDEATPKEILQYREDRRGGMYPPEALPGSFELHGLW